MKQALDTRTKLLTKNPWPLMIELSIPAVLGMVVVGLYNMMDSIFVGQMVGDVQMGAISVSYPLTLINAGSAAMLGVGSASVLSRAIGKKDRTQLRRSWATWLRWFFCCPSSTLLWVWFSPASFCP